MNGGDNRIWERLAKIQSSCERTRTVATGNDRNVKATLLKEQRELTNAFMERMRDERDNGKNAALRQFADMEYSFFSKFDSVTDDNTVMLLRSSAMDRKDAEDESLMLSQEYLLDMAEQSLRLVCIMTLDEEKQEF